MRKTFYRFIGSVMVIMIAAIIFPIMSIVEADTWRGTAPFCAGECLPGETKIGTSDSGDGGYCWTGHKVLCRNTAPTCNPTQTNTSCAGVVKICDNGYYTIPDVWHSCSKYACGACLGIGSKPALTDTGSFVYPLTEANGVIYAIVNNDDLLWYGHNGRNDGTFRWASNEGKKVGNEWDVKHVFSGGDGIIYAITQNNDLMWYRHDGRNDGTFRWASNEGKKVGNGWDVKHVFSGATTTR